MNARGLAHSGMPLGGLGTGSVELRSDGYFHEWQVMNNSPWGSGPEAQVPLDGLFFGLHVRGHRHDRSAVLGAAPGYNSHLCDPYHMPWLEHASSIDASTRFPFTRLAYHYERFPLDATLEAFSPFIPLDSRNSGLPLAFLGFTLKNRTASALDVALLGALRNLVGYSTQDRLSSMSLIRDKGCTAIRFSREDMPAQSNDDGTMALAVSTDGRGSVTHVFHPRNCRDIWDPLRKTLCLENVDVGEYKGAIGNRGDSREAQLRRGLPLGVLSQRLSLKPGEQRTVTFALAWHFPHFRERDYREKQKPGSVIGHRYAEWFRDATEVTGYGHKNRATLRERSLRFTQAYYRSTFPEWLLDAVAAQLTTLVKSSWWDRSGRFGIWEGLGCCGLQTMDITHYGSFPIVQMFADIQKSQMRLTADNMDGPGKVPHMMPGTFCCGDVDHSRRIDLIPQFIINVWRDVLWTGDLAYARQMWPHITQALAVCATFDRDGDGLPNNSGPDQTYDQFPLKGTSAFVGFLYAASLRAAAELARLMGQADMERQLIDKLSDAVAKLDTQLWNGSYYRLSYDPLDGAANEGVMADQINADWFVRQTTGAGLLPDDRVRSSLDQILRHCGAPQGYIANCAWPKGGATEIGRHTSDQANCPWSGVEYALAAHLVLAGMEKQGVSLARDVWERYEAAGLRFNHIECGGHYYRAMSSWALYLALTGFAADAPKGELSLRVRGSSTTYLLCTPDGWGMVRVRMKSRGTRKTEGEIHIDVEDGAIRLRKLRLLGLHCGTARVSVGGDVVKASVGRTDEGAALTLARAVTLRKGKGLTIKGRADA